MVIVHRRARRHRRRGHARRICSRKWSARSKRGPPARRRSIAIAQGRLRVPGTMRLDELGQEFDLDLEHEDVDSVSGLVLTLLGRPPVVGDTRPLRPAAVRGDGGQGARRRGVRGGSSE